MTRKFLTPIVLPADPAAPMEAATKQYVDAVAQGLNAKASVRLASDVSIGGGSAPGTNLPVDGVATVQGDRVLLKNQSNPQYNGIYVVNAVSTWNRAPDADTWGELVSAFTFVEEGTTQADTGWVCTANRGGTLGTTAIPWTQFSAAGGASGAAGGDLGGTYPNPTVLKGQTGFTAAAIAATSLSGGGALSVRTPSLGDTNDRLLVNGTGVISLGSGTAAPDTNLYRDAADSLRTSDKFTADAGLVSGAQLDMTSHKIVNLIDPVAAQDAATKNYVDGLAGGGGANSDAKASVRLASVGQHSMIGTPNVDGVPCVVGDRVLLKAQNAPAENGIYIVANGSWTRATDLNSWAQVPGAFMFVEEGLTQADTGWVCTANQGGTIGTTAMAWTQFSAQDPTRHTPVRLTTTANITLSGNQSIDSVTTVPYDRVLLRGQTTATENGIWVTASGAWTRAADADTAAKVARGQTVLVTQGTFYQWHVYTQVFNVNTFASDAQMWRVVTQVDMHGSLLPPTPLGAGHLTYNSTQHTLQVFDGGSWYLIDGQAICTSTTRPNLFGLADGFRMYETDTGRSYILIGGAWVSTGVSSSSGPVGTISMWAGAAPPAGSLNCDGTSFSSLTYPALAALLADTFGTHSGTTYYLPDFRGRSPVGPGSPSPLDGYNYIFGLGAKFGESMHPLTGNEMPNHNHQQQVQNGSPGGGPPWSNGNSFYGWSNSAGVSGTYTAGTGGNAAHNITQPVLGINFIIRATEAADPTVSGGASYTAPVAALTAGTWLNITHSLGTEDVGVWVKEAASKENVNVDWKVVDSSSIALRSHSDVAANFLTAVVKR